VPDWPLISDLGPLGALPTAPRLARGFAAVVLNGWGLDDQVDVTELLVSELATNVIRASTTSDGQPRYDDDGKLPLLWVRLLSDQSRLMIEVWDNLPQVLGAPVVRHPEPDEESGRGLEMVSALSEDWGWESVPGWRGKRVWALLGLLGPGFMALPRSSAPARLRRLRPKVSSRKPGSRSGFPGVPDRVQDYMGDVVVGEGVLDFAGLAAGGHDMRAAQDTQMLRDQRLAHAEGGHEFVHPPAAGRQLPHDTQPDR